MLLPMSSIRFVLIGVILAGCGSSDGLITKGEFCSRTAAPLCDRFVSCGLLTAAQRSQCTTDFQTGCCNDDNSCGERAANMAEETAIEQTIAACSAAAPTADCAQLAAGNPPVACGGSAALESQLITPVAGTPTRRLGQLSSGALLRARPRQVR